MSNVSVAVRVRPISKREEAQTAKIIVSVKDDRISVTNPKVPANYNQEYDNREKVRQFSVDFAYLSLDINSTEYVTQECIYQSLGVNVLTSVFEGFNACVLAYGQSGTGKTYTMMGHSGDLGLTPRICQGLFSRISTMNDKKMTFRIEVSFLEIYNERVVDLLRSLPSRRQRQTLKVREHPKFGPYVQDLSRHVVTDFGTTQALLEKGIQNRSVAATRMHDYSSRSHAIFTIYFTQARLDEEFPSEVTSKIHLVDLAGSERATADLSRARLKEGANINKSLVALGNVICSLADKSQSIWSLESNSSSRSSTGDSAGCPTSTASPVGSPSQKCRVAFVPYRDSVLTWLLKDSLGGNAKTIMLATISPASVSYSETLSTLRYAQRAKCIVNRPVTNEDASVKLIRELRAEIERLRSMLSSAQNDSRNQLKDEWPVCQIISRNQNKAEELTRTWFEKWKEMQHRMHFSSFLANAHTMDSVVDCEMPYLIGINSDLPSSGVHIYYLKEGTMLVGNNNCGSENAPDICIFVEDIAEQHCILQLEDRVATLTPITGALCLLNGVKITSSIKVSLGDVIQLGKSITLRYLDPCHLPRPSKSIQSSPDFSFAADNEAESKVDNPEVCSFHSKGNGGFQQWTNHGTTEPSNKKESGNSEMKDPNVDSLLGDSQSDLASCEDIGECKSLAADWLQEGENTSLELLPENSGIPHEPSTEAVAVVAPRNNTVSEMRAENGADAKKQKNCKGLRLVIKRPDSDGTALSNEAEGSIAGNNDEFNDSLECLDQCIIDRDSYKLEEDLVKDLSEGEDQMSRVDAVMIHAPQSNNPIELPTRTRCQYSHRSKISDFYSTDEENWASKGGKCRRKVTALNAMIAMQKRRKKRKKVLPSRFYSALDSTSEDEFLPSTNSHMRNKKAEVMRKLNRPQIASPPALPSPYEARLTNEDRLFSDINTPNRLCEMIASFSNDPEDMGHCFVLPRADRSICGNVSETNSPLYQSADFSDQVCSSKLDHNITTDSLDDEGCSLRRLNLDLDDGFARSSSKTLETWPTSCDSLTFVYLGPAADWKSSQDVLFQCETMDSGDKRCSSAWEQQPTTKCPPYSDESDTLTQEFVLSGFNRKLWKTTLGKTYSVLPDLSNYNSNDDEICSISDEHLSETKYFGRYDASLHESLRNIGDYSQSTLDVIGSPDKIPDAAQGEAMKHEISVDYDVEQSTCKEERNIVTIPAEETAKNTSVANDRLSSSASPKGPLSLNSFDSGIFVGLHGTASNTLKNLQMSFSFVEPGANFNRSLPDQQTAGHVDTAAIGKCDIAVTVNKPNEMRSGNDKGTARDEQDVVNQQKDGAGSPFEKMGRHIVDNILREERDEDTNRSFSYWEQQVWPSGNGFASFLSPSTSAPPSFLPQASATVPKSDIRPSTASPKAQSEPSSRRRVAWTWKDPVDLLIDLSHSDLEDRCGSLETKLDMLEKRHANLKRKKEKNGHCDALDVDPRAHCECEELEGVSREPAQAKGCTCSSRTILVTDSSSVGYMGSADSDVEFSGHIPEDMIRLLRECRDVRKKAWREIGLAQNQLRCMEAVNKLKSFPPCPIHAKLMRS